MGYYIDLRTISLDNYRQKLLSTDLLPSRQILKEFTAERFDHFKSLGIGNLFELQQFLKKKTKVAELSGNNLFKGDYLAILLREINSMQPKPNLIADFVCIPPDTTAKLALIGIKDTCTLFERVKTPSAREKLSVETSVPLPEILLLTKLTDLSRIKWVGAMFAYVLLKTGYDTVEKVASASYPGLYHLISTLNLELKLYKGNIGLNDIKLCVNAAKDVPLDIDYTG